MKDTNPKTLVGNRKVPLALVPPVAVAHEADAFRDGAAKYGPYNWRENPVSVMTYLHAAKRHIDAYLDGANIAPDSGAHHLGHARASLGIVLDAEACGALVDDRPLPGAATRTHEALEHDDAAPPADPAPRRNCVPAPPADDVVPAWFRVGQRVRTCYSSTSATIERVWEGRAALRYSNPPCVGEPCWYPVELTPVDDAADV